jgi:hypothetical protein
MRAVLIALLMSGAVASPAFAQPQAAKVARRSADALALAEIAVPRGLYLSSEVQRVTLDWSNRPDPEFEAKIEQLMLETVERFVGTDLPR